MNGEPSRLADVVPRYSTLDEWIHRERIPFSDDPQALEIAVDRVVVGLGEGVRLLGLGEALHGGAGLLELRNRVFRRLVEDHGFSAIAIESSLTRGRLVDEYVQGRGPASYDDLRDAGFSHGFGALEANRDLVEWMREFNAGTSRRVPLRFYGFDSPTEMTHADSPRRLLELVLDALAMVDDALSAEHRERIGPLLGPDAVWENPEAMMDPGRSVGLSPEAAALRVATEDLVADLTVRRPGLVAAFGTNRYLEAAQHGSAARLLLAYHAQMARKVGTGERLVRGLGLRDAMMAENLAFVAARERGRGRVLAFAHNSHLQRGPARWQLGPHALAWATAGAHLDALFGAGYAAIGTAVGVSEDHGIGRPEEGSLEALLGAAAEPSLFVPTRRGLGLPRPEIASLSVRSGGTPGEGYFPLTAQSLADFDWIAFLGAMA